MTGAGYVGLVSEACCGFRSRRHLRRQEENKIAALHPGKIAIYEPGVDGLVATTPRPSAEVHHRSVQAGRGCRCRFVLCLCGRGRLAQSLSGLTVVVTNSTVPVGIGDEVERIIRETNKANIVVAFNPEFQREGARSATSNSPPHRPRHRRRVLPQGDERHLWAALTEPGAADFYGTLHRRDDQIRRKRVPCDHHLHQRSPQTSPERSVPSRRRSSAALAWKTASAPNSCMRVPASVVVLPEGHEGADQDRERSRRVLAFSSRSMRTASARWREK
jgi:hypothetical protein